jgi:hypothetical protein
MVTLYWAGEDRHPGFSTDRLHRVPGPTTLGAPSPNSRAGVRLADGFSRGRAAA